MKKVNMTRRHREPQQRSGLLVPVFQHLSHCWTTGPRACLLPSSIDQINQLLRMEMGTTHSDHLPSDGPSSPVLFAPHPGFTPLTAAVLCPCSCPQHSQQLYRHIYLSCKEETNIQKHYEALYGLLALISIELANEEVMVDLIRLVLAVQVGPDVGSARCEECQMWGVLDVGSAGRTS